MAEQRIAVADLQQLARLIGYSRSKEFPCNSCTILKALKRIRPVTLRLRLTAPGV